MAKIFFKFVGKVSRGVLPVSGCCRKYPHVQPAFYVPLFCPCPRRSAKASPLDSKAVWEKAVREPIDRRLPGAMERLAVALKRGGCNQPYESSKWTHRVCTRVAGAYRQLVGSRSPVSVPRVFVCGRCFGAFSCLTFCLILRFICGIPSRVAQATPFVCCI